MRKYLMTAFGLGLMLTQPLRADYCIEATPAVAAHIGGSEKCGFASHQAAQDWINQNLPNIAGVWIKDNGGPTTSSGAQPTGGGYNPQTAAQLGDALGKSLFGNAPSTIAPISGLSQDQIAAQQLNRMGVWYLKNGDNKNAEIEFEKALRRSPNDPSIYNNLKLAQKREGESTTTGAESGAATSGSGSDNPTTSYTANADSAPVADNNANSGYTSGTTAGQETGVKGLPGIYLNDNPGNGGAPGTGRDPQATTTATTPATTGTETIPTGLPAATAEPNRTLNVGNAGNPDFDGHQGGNAPITASGGPATPSSSPEAGANPAAGGQTANSSGAGQLAVPLGVPPDKAGLTPASGVSTAGSGNPTGAGDQLVSAAAAGQNSGANFDSGGKYAGSLNPPAGGAGNGGSSDVVNLSGTTPTNADLALMKHQWQMSIDPRYKSDPQVQQNIRDLWKAAQSSDEATRLDAANKIQAILTDQLKVEGWTPQQIKDFFANVDKFTTNDGKPPAAWGQPSTLARQIDDQQPMNTKISYQDLLLKSIGPAKSIKADVSYMGTDSQTADDCVIYAIANGAQVPVGQVKDAFATMVKDLGVARIEERNNPDLATTDSQLGGLGGLNPLEELLTAGKVGTVTAVTSVDFAQAIETTGMPVVTTINGNHEVLVTGAYQTADGNTYYSVMDSNLKGYEKYTAFIDRQLFEGKMTWGGYVITPAKK